MHPALTIQEILFNIFGHCRTNGDDFGLSSLARTCTIFKEPALDMLWEELRGLSPLARCLPEHGVRGLPVFISHFLMFHFFPSSFLEVGLDLQTTHTS